MKKDKIQENKDRSGIAISLIYIAMLLLCFGACLFYKRSISELLRCEAMLVLMLLLVAFCDKRAIILGDYLYDNGEHRLRFFFVFLGLFVVALLFPLFTSGGWPFLFIALVLLLLSNPLMGMAGFVTLLTFCCNLSLSDTNTFLFHFFCGCCVIVLFSLLNESFRIEMPLILSLLCYCVSCTANILLLQNANLSISLALIPLIGLFLNAILMFIFLWIMNVKVISAQKNQFLELNDPEYILMKEIKKKDENAYKEAIHTAYLCNKIASRLSISPQEVRCSGFYLNSSVLAEEVSEKGVEEILDSYKIPERVKAIILDTLFSKKVITKEACIVAMSSLVIRAIQKINSTKADKKVDYESIITQLFDLKQKSHYFDSCSISYADMMEMRSIMIKEDLYYELIH